MKRRHIALLSKSPERAQVSNFMVKLESTSEIIDRLLLVPRQQPWKATGSSGTSTSTTGTTTGTGTSTTGTGTGAII